MTSTLTMSHGGKSVSEIFGMVVTFPLALIVFLVWVSILFPIAGLAWCGIRVLKFLKKGVIHWFELADRWFNL